MYNPKTIGDIQKKLIKSLKNKKTLTRFLNEYTEFLVYNGASKNLAPYQAIKNCRFFLEYFGNNELVNKFNKIIEEP